ncbi:MAG: hypothetical protein H6907_11500 [Hyphomicrobiales bacterium]|nr:hypothetical protein [Hyphomicrobiales bacterium]MCP5372347.1 hypothetical protein [Hyphomicrobiales bacterium]
MTLEDLFYLALVGLSEAPAAQVDALVGAVTPGALAWLDIGLGPAAEDLAWLYHAEDLPRA